jgi:general secretion pathway protein F
MRYRVKAIRGFTEVAILPVEAVSEAEALAYARRQGYDVVSVHRDRGIRLGFAVRGRALPVVQLTRELIALLKAGLNLVEAIEILHRKEPAVSARTLLADLLARLRQGLRFSVALEAFPLLFSPLYIATVRAAEGTGTIKDALARYVDYQTQIEKVRSKVVSAAIYPALLLAVGGLVTLFLLGYVVPRFSRLYEGMGDRLPLFSHWFMQSGQFIDRHGAWVLTGLLAAGAVLFWVTIQSEPRAYLLRGLLKLPVLGRQRRTYELGQFYRTVGMLLRSGLPVLPALDMAKGLLSPALRLNLERVAQKVRAGTAFSAAMNEFGLATPVAYSMIVVAERSGNLSEMLEVVAGFHEEELARWIDGFTRLFEPVLMAVIGIVIGSIVVFMYMPIFELAETIQ